MKRTFILLLCFMFIKKITAQPDYKSYPVYYEKDLGLTYSKEFSIFKVWAPTAAAGELLLYKEGDDGKPFKTINLEKGIRGTWHSQVEGDLAGTFYSFRVNIDGKWSNEVPDPYAKAVGVNGKKAMVMDLKATNPAGWDTDKSPVFSSTNKATDAV